MEDHTKLLHEGWQHLSSLVDICGFDEVGFIMMGVSQTVKINI